MDQSKDNPSYRMTSQGWNFMLAPPPSAGEALGTRHLGEHWGEPKYSLPTFHTSAHLTRAETGPFLHCDGNMFI